MPLGVGLRPSDRALSLIRDFAGARRRRPHRNVLLRQSERGPDRIAAGERKLHYFVGRRYIYVGCPPPPRPSARR